MEFSLRDGMEGDLYVDCYVESADEVAETYVDRGFSTKVSHSDTAVTANVENATVRYLTKDAYNEGDFTDDALLSEPPFDAGSVVYTVIDFSLKAAKNNDGGHTMGVMFSVSNQFALYSNIEDAPTNKIMKKANGSSMNLYAAYTVPESKSEAKNIRMIFETVTLGGGAVSVDVYLVGAPDVVLNGTTHMKALPERTVTGHALEYRLSVDRTFYTVASVFSDTLANIDIPDALEDGIPVTAIEVGTFSNLTHITSVTIGDNVKSLSDGAFTGCIALESVRLGTGIKSIGTDAFAYTAVTIIEFDGTKAQWNAIEKAEGWAGNSSITGVTCSDGTVSPNDSTSSNWPFIESPV